MRMNTNDRVNIKHVGTRYFLCLDPRGDNCGIFVDAWGTPEIYPLDFVDAAPKTVDEIAAEWAEVGESSNFFEYADAGTPTLTAFYQSIILAAIEEALCAAK